MRPRRPWGLGEGVYHPNSYAAEDPIRIFEDAGYLDLVKAYDDDSFTYKFDGRYGRLDYIMASPSAKRLVDDVAVWKINSAEPCGYLYFNEWIDLTAYASSDHDPVLAAISQPRGGTEPSKKAQGRRAEAAVEVV
jgi:predicted extracellular nuclease